MNKDRMRILTRRNCYDRKDFLVQRDKLKLENNPKRTGSWQGQMEKEPILQSILRVSFLCVCGGIKQNQSFVTIIFVNFLNKSKQEKQSILHCLLLKMFMGGTFGGDSGYLSCSKMKKAKYLSEGTEQDIYRFF